MPTQAFLFPSGKEDVSLAASVAAFYDFFLRQSYSTTSVVGAAINKPSKVTETRIELGFLTHDRPFKFLLHLFWKHKMTGEPHILVISKI